MSLLLQLACQSYRSQQRAEGIEPHAEASVTATSSSPQAVEVNPKLYPVDEAQEDPLFAEFRSKLLSAANEHDSKYVLS